MPGGVPSLCDTLARMPGIMLLCPRHGLRESPIFNHTNGARVVMTGNTGSLPCPVCGLPSEIADGDYTTDEQNNLRAEIWLTKQQAEQLRRQFQAIDRIAQKPRLSDDEARQQIDELLDEIAANGNPEVVQEYRRRADPSDRKTWPKSAKAVIGGLVAVALMSNDIVTFADNVQRVWDFLSTSTGTGGVVEVHDPQPDDGWSLPPRDA